MAILEYVPPIKNITDNRTQRGDYYRASCDVCGTEFYPKRRSAKYCTPNCKVIQHRIDVANGKITKEIKTFTRKSNSDKKNIIRGPKNVYLLLKDKYNTYGDREYILCGLNDLEFGQSFIYEKYEFTKISTMLFEVKK
jgi:hypothetical protein